MNTDMYEPPIPPPALLGAFHSTWDDLAANRAGRLGPQQAERLRRSAVWNLIGAACLAACLAAIVLAVAQRPLKPVQVIIAGALGLALVVLGVTMFVRLRRAAELAVVERASGSVRVVRRGRAGLFIVVDGHDFRLPIRPRHVANGGTYHVYFTPAAQRIVSMEPTGP
jgi:hypothetical protein